MNSINLADMQILLHEMGHTFGLDDFYGLSLISNSLTQLLTLILDWTPSGVTNFIMLAGSSGRITDFDGWMLRNWWYELKRNRGW